jgi:hypothetical protein
MNRSHRMRSARDEYRAVEEQATPADYRDYFGVPPKTLSAPELFDWAAAVTSRVETELERTSLASFHRDVLCRGLETALEVLSGNGNRTVLS